MDNAHTHTIVITHLAEAMKGFLVACEAADCPPLWARLARAAVDGGFFDDAGYGPRADQWLGILHAATQAAWSAGAPAADRVIVREADPADRLAEYETCTGTTVTVDRVGVHTCRLTIVGGALSVLRRASAVARALELPIAFPAALAAEAETEAADRAAWAASAKVRTMVDQAEALGRVYEAVAE